MTLLTRRRDPVDPVTAAALAAAREAETRAEVERARALAELRREQAAADRAAALDAERDARRARKEREAARAQEKSELRAKRSARLAAVRQVTPLIIINAASAYVQAAYAYDHIAPKDWPQPARVVLAVIFAAAGETIALYVQWHAHDALVQRAYGTAAKLRRASWAIAAVFATLNYSHFTTKLWEPTPAGVAVATFTLLSPWLWGLHTRRAQHMQLLAEDPSLIDSEGAQFSLERRRAFPIRSWRARRWSIDHGVRDPRAAWAGYNRERGRRHAAAQPVDDLDQNTATMLAIIRLQARRARQAVAAGLPSRFRTPVTQTVNQPATVTPPHPSVDRQPDPSLGGQKTVSPQPQKSAVRPSDDRPNDGSGDGQMTAKQAVRKSVTRRSTTADRVARAAAKLPANATVAQIAKKAGVSESSARRHLPRTTS